MPIMWQPSSVTHKFFCHPICNHQFSHDQNGEYDQCSIVILGSVENPSSLLNEKVEFLLSSILLLFKFHCFFNHDAFFLSCYFFVV